MKKKAMKSLINEKLLEEGFITEISEAYRYASGLRRVGLLVCNMAVIYKELGPPDAQMQLEKDSLD